MALLQLLGYYIVTTSLTSSLFSLAGKRISISRTNKTNFRCFGKLSIIDQNFHFCQKLRFLANPLLFG